MQYVAFWRDWMIGPQAENTDRKDNLGWMAVGRRSIGRSETNDFNNFPVSRVVIEPGPDLRPSQVYYSQCKTTIPGAPDNHLMFPGVWETLNDTTFIEMYSSHDTHAWHKISSNPVLKTAIFGEWDGGCVFAVPNLVELPNGDFALPYTGFNVPHKYPRVKATKATGYALWPKGRIVSVESREKGEFTTVAVVPPGKKLLINAVTNRAGYVLIEALDINGNIIQGRDFQNARPVIGDNYMTHVVWKEHDDLGINPGEAISFRFKLQEAEIYSLDFI